MAEVPVSFLYLWCDGHGSFGTVVTGEGSGTKTQACYTWTRFDREVQMRATRLSSLVWGLDTGQILQNICLPLYHQATNEGRYYGEETRMG